MSISLELISHQLCPFVHRAAAMLEEKGVSYATRFVDLRAKPEWFLALSPRGKVPVLLANGVTIFESAVILEFIDETHAPRIMPEDPFERARQRGWIEVANDVFLAQYKVASSPNTEEREVPRTTLRALFERFETDVRGPYFAGETFGIVDLAMAPAFFRLRLLESWLRLGALEGLPRVAAWGERLASRPSVVRAVVPDFEERYRASLQTR